jgi:lipopolysaccharide biosynthesis protein
MTQLIAWYLPQFHRFTENDQFWGEGFTEWTSLNAAKPQFPEHTLQFPEVGIGQYNLLDRDVRASQAALAKQFGVHGFCYYHYWFDRPLMDAPLQLMLRDGEPDLPFCLSWANEPWRRMMNGGDASLLVPAAYGGVQEWDRHFAYLVPFFKHPNYITVDDRPVLLLYRPSAVPNLSDRLRRYGELAAAEGLNKPFVIATLGNFREPPQPYPVDAAVEFFPNWMGTTDVPFEQVQHNRVYEMADAYSHMLQYPKMHERQFLGLMPGFDSSPRNSQIANIFRNGTPQMFRNALTTQLLRSTEPFMFLNAWNEWGEQAVLEPSEQHGHAYLRAVRAATSHTL